MDYKQLDQLAWQAVFGSDSEKNKAYVTLWNLAQKHGLRPASINNLYLARGRGELPLDFTVPAINLRGMVYDMGRALFQTAVKQKVGALIVELARSEMGYTAQPPQEYVAVILAAALRENFTGSVFIQGDHFQLKLGDRAGQPKADELDKVKTLIKDSINAGFYNIDIDTSTLVDYSRKSIEEQQRTNYELSAQLAQYVRQIQPAGVTVSLGGEIGHIGGKNSTEAELRAYMEGFKREFVDGAGLSKISIQTGTHHGGVVLPDGSLAKVAVDFSVLKQLAQVSREYAMGGTVQHGASTLPDEYFNQFPKSEAIEVHLATGFQNIIMDHPQFPKQLLTKMYCWLDREKIEECKPDQTEEQFHYKLRKKAWGEFKKDCWLLSERVKQPIRIALAKRFQFMFEQLNVVKSQTLINRFVKPAPVKKTA